MQRLHASAKIPSKFPLPFSFNEYYDYYVHNFLLNMY